MRFLLFLAVITHSDNYRWVASGSRTKDPRGSGRDVVRRQNGTAAAVLEGITLQIKSKSLFFADWIGGHLSKI